MKTNLRHFWRHSNILFIGLMVTFGTTQSFSEGSPVSLLTLGEGTDAPAPLLNLLQEQISPLESSGELCRRLPGGGRPISRVLPEAEGSLDEPSRSTAASRRSNLSKEPFRTSLKNRASFQGFTDIPL